MKIQRKAKENKTASEAVTSPGAIDGVVVGGGGPVSTTDFRKDFEEAAAKLRAVLKIGDTTTGDGKPVKAEQLNIEPAGTPNPSKKGPKKREPQGVASESISVIMGVTNDGGKKWWKADTKEWVDSQEEATKYDDLMDGRMEWINVTNGGRKLPEGFKRIFQPNYTPPAEEAIIHRNSRKRADENAGPIDKFDKMYDGAYLTVVGAGGPIEDWKEGLQNEFDKKNIGKVSEWITFTGADMNDKYNLRGTKKYPEDLTFLACPLDGLDTRKLATFRLQWDPTTLKWFNDIVDNNR